MLNLKYLKQVLQEQLSKLQSDYATDEDEIKNLNDSIASITSSNKNYSQQAIDAIKLNKDLLFFFDSIAQRAGVSFDDTTPDKVLADDILTAFDNKDAENASLKEQLLAVKANTAVAVPSIIKASLPKGFIVKFLRWLVIKLGLAQLT